MDYKIKVTNKTKKTFTDYYQGIAYKFPGEGETVSISPQAAQHIFGIEFPPDEAVCASPEFRAELFKAMQKRWGWNRTDRESIDTAKKTFGHLSFVPVMVKTVELVAKNEDLPSPSENQPVFKPAEVSEGA